MPERLRVTPLGGSGEIGLNCLMFEADGQTLLVDAGMMLPWGNGYGIDVVIPDFEPACRGPGELRALVLTHGHEDHIGAAPYLLRRRNVPVYGPPLALALLRERLDEFELNHTPRLVPLVAGDLVSIGPFQIEGIAVRHSIPDSLGLAVNTPAGRVVLSGDFKLDDSDVGGPPTDLARFAEIGRQGVLALFSDSTNASHPGRSGSEAEAARVIEDLVSAAGGRVFVAVFASHLYRLRMLTRLAARHGRRVVFSGRSLQTNVRVARELTGWGLGREVEVGEAEAAELDPNQVLVITTGSQGEPLSALFRMAVGQHKYFSARPGDLVIL
ncbi:MAG: ribonuclease J, partial [Proteobacteria bacterium]|nr:ribonuclease J [Pseudomonadota bacterium]